MVLTHLKSNYYDWLFITFLCKRCSQFVVKKTWIWIRVSMWLREAIVQCGNHVYCTHANFRKTLCPTPISKVLTHLKYDYSVLLFITCLGKWCSQLGVQKNLYLNKSFYIASRSHCAMCIPCTLFPSKFQRNSASDSNFKRLNTSKI